MTVYETYHPGSVVALYAFDYIKQKWIRIWSVFDDITIGETIKSNEKARRRGQPPKVARKFEPKILINVYSE